MTQLVRRTVVAVAALLAVLGLAACGSTKLKGPQVASQMKSEALAPKGVTNATVNCPAETEAKAGAVIECSVTSDGKKGDVTAKVADDEGTLSDYKANVDEIQLALIEKNAEEEESGLSQVNCPSSSKPKKGATFFCTGKIPGSGFGVVVINQTAEDSSVKVRLQRRRLKTAKLTQNLEKAVEKRFPGINVNASCPKRLESRKGQVISCTVKNPANDRQATLRFRQKTSEADSFVPIK
ncbi:MAG: DUF4333 domain-containing protein [Actinomycetota bacterium]|nr:DUF4333 domain-containing protein [Actinomycetota bacterium]